MEFNENSPKGSGDIEQTRNSKVNPLTLTCDLKHLVKLRGTFEFSLMKIV